MRRTPDLESTGSTIQEQRFSSDLKDLLGGYFSNTGEEVRFISKAKGRGRSFNLPLYLASSSARGISALYFLSRDRIEPWQLLMIDEPESHLDTRNQIEFARILARVIRAGGRVLLTTHSDYILKEFNNLIMWHRIAEHADGEPSGLPYDGSEKLDPTAVRAYVAEDGGLTPCKIGPYGLNVPMFDKVIDDINERSNKLCARIDSNASVPASE